MEQETGWAESGQMPSSELSPRIRRELRTLDTMVRMYCADHHESAEPESVDVDTALCEECTLLLEYSLRRIQACRYGERKPTCARCTVHCFRASMREKVREVMRYSGPRMTIRHPYLAARHLLDRRPTPEANGAKDG